MKDLAYLHWLLDQVVEKYSLSVAITAIGDAEIKTVQVLRELAQAGDDTQVGVKE